MSRTDYGNLTIRFFVTAARDIADFLIYIRNNENDVLYQGEAAYNERTHEIPIENIRDKIEGQKAEICIISKDSNGITGRWFSAQCTNLPDLKQKRKGIFTFTSFSSANCKTAKTMIPTIISLLLVHFSLSAL